MFDNVINFKSNNQSRSVILPFSLAFRLNDYSDLQKSMIRNRDPNFSRSEWAYLINFISKSNLKSIFVKTFGEITDIDINNGLYYSPFTHISVWLPNNVSLLGPLTVAMLSLIGARVEVKVGSRSLDLVSKLRDFIVTHQPESKLANWFTQEMKIHEVDRTSSVNKSMSAAADVRIVFGSNDAARGVDLLDHPLHSKGLYFSDRVSEAWISADFINEKSVLKDLVSVFMVYGQAGCTSPKRICIIGGDSESAKFLQNNLIKNWESYNLPKVEQNIASQNILLKQLLDAEGRPNCLAPGSSAVFFLDEVNFPAPRSNNSISVQAGRFEDFIESQPDNLQTIGYALTPNDKRCALPLISRMKSVSRFVNLANMHDFGPVWDDRNWFLELFRVTDVE